MKRKQMTVAVTLSVAPYVTKAEAVRELRSRCNDLCCWALEGGEVRVRKIGRATPNPRADALSIAREG